jgi:hypothetical protein
MKRLFATTVALALTVGSAGAQQEVIINGGFEAGTFAGWTAQVWPNSAGNVQVTSSTVGPYSGLTQIGPHAGTYYALTDMGGPGAYSVFQTFNILAPSSSATLSFALSVSNYAGTTIIGSNFDPFNSGANQYVSVDLFRGSLTDGFSTAVPLQNFFKDTYFGAPSPYIVYTFDVTQWLDQAGDYTIRFNEVDNQLFLNMAVDDVSLVNSSVPEPASIVLLATGLIGVFGVVRRRRSGNFGSRSLNA